MRSVSPTLEDADENSVGLGVGAGVGTASQANQDYFGSPVEAPLVDGPSPDDWHPSGMLDQTGGRDEKCVVSKQTPARPLYTPPLDNVSAGKTNSHLMDEGSSEASHIAVANTKGDELDAVVHRTPEDAGIGYPSSTTALGIDDTDDEHDLSETVRKVAESTTPQEENPEVILVRHLIARTPREPPNNKTSLAAHHVFDHPNQACVQQAEASSFVSGGSPDRKQKHVAKHEEADCKHHFDDDDAQSESSSINSSFSRVSSRCHPDRPLPSPKRDYNEWANDLELEDNIETNPPSNFVRIPCSKCFRSFQPSSLARHERTCKGLPDATSKTATTTSKRNKSSRLPR
jgi:hypothetical protein